MSEQQYSESNLMQQPLIDSDQWGRLCSELGLDMLLEFADEFFDETREQWFEPAPDLTALSEKSFKSMAHRSAGAAGTIGFVKLRYVFLCMEHNTMGPETARLIESMQGILGETESWVKAQQ